MVNKKEKIEGKLLIPKIDVVFRALFREENKRLTEALISDILGEKVKIKTTNKDRHLNIKDPRQKLGIIDLRTELEDGTNCNIEIQLSEHDYENERFLYYWADAYSRQLLRGENYDALHKTISIIILDHEIETLKGDESLDTKWQIRDNKTGKRLLTEQLEIAIIEIPKAIRLYRKNAQDKICQWMLFLNNPNESEVSKIMDENKDIKEAVEELEGMSKDEELRRLAELREKAIRDEHAAMSFAIKKGLKIGIKQGIEQGIEKGIEKGIEQGIEKGIEQNKLEIAKNMLRENMDIELIKKITGVKEKDIEKLKNELDKNMHL